MQAIVGAWARRPWLASRGPWRIGRQAFQRARVYVCAHLQRRPILGVDTDQEGIPVRRDPTPAKIDPVRLASRALALCVGVCCSLALSAPALATNLFTLDPHSATNGPVVTDSSGNAYIAWEREASNPALEPPTVRVCKIAPGGTCTSPQTLAIPAPGTEPKEAPTEVFPVLGSAAGVVYVVGPDYDEDDHSAVWKSTNGGASFSAPKQVTIKGLGLDLGDVLLNPLSGSEGIDVGSLDPSLAFSETGYSLSKPFTLDFGKAGNGGGPTLGFTRKGAPVEAEWVFSGKGLAVETFHLKNGTSPEKESDWVGEKFSGAYEPRIAGGPDGLFLLSTELAAGAGEEEQPTELTVRKFEEGTEKFGPPMHVGSVNASVPDLFQSGGLAENPGNGTLYVVYPSEAGEAYEMRAWESTNGGQSFERERYVANIGSPYSGPPRLAVSEGGQAWLTFKGETGLEVANLKTLTTLTTNLSGGGQSGASITVDQGVSVTDTARVGGQVASSATGTVSYEIFSNSSCTGSAISAGSGGVSGGAAAASSAETLAPGKYYWRATYTGEDINEPSQSGCGSEVLTVLAATTTTTVQSGDGVSGGSLTLPQGTSVTDQAHVSGALAANATGTVTYRLYKDSKCTEEAAPASVVSVAGGSAAPSKAVAPKVGTYYWKAEYSGDSANEGSASACGSEVLVVAALDNNVGLPSTHICLSKRKFIAHPRAPKGVKLVHVEIFINGVLKAQGPLNHDHTTIDLIGLPKGTFHVAMVVRSSTGKLYEDIRTYHTCVPGKPKKKKG